MKKLVTLLFFITGTLITYGQEIAYLKKVGPVTPFCLGEHITQLQDGSLLTLGTIMRYNASGQYLRDMMLIKSKLNGDTIWTKIVGEPSVAELGREFEVLPDGKILIAGFSVYNNGTARAGMLTCTDSAGNTLWRKTYGAADTFSFTSLKVVQDGIALAGTCVNNGSEDALLLKVNMDGDSLWSQTIGGPEYDDAWDVDITPEGGFILTGGTYSFADGDYDDAWLIKTDPSGNVIWRKTYGLADRVDWAWAVVPVFNGGNIEGYVFTGLKNSGEPETMGEAEGDLHLVKVDTAGVVLWDKTISLPAGSLRKEGTDIKQLPDGGFVICASRMYLPGTTRMYIVRTNANGDIVSEVEHGDNTGALMPRSIVPTTDGEFAVAGYVFSNNAQQIFIAKTGDAATGIRKKSEVSARVTVYPNPANGIFTITSDQPVEELCIYSADGRLLKSVSGLNRNKLTLDSRDYPSGMIILNVKTAEGSSSRQVMIR
jgi:hypothetical protein